MALYSHLRLNLLRGIDDPDSSLCLKTLALKLLRFCSLRYNLKLSSFVCRWSTTAYQWRISSYNKRLSGQRYDSIIAWSVSEWCAAKLTWPRLLQDVGMWFVQLINLIWQNFQRSPLYWPHCMSLPLHQHFSFSYPALVSDLKKSNTFWITATAFGRRLFTSEAYWLESLPH